MSQRVASSFLEGRAEDERAQGGGGTGGARQRKDQGFIPVSPAVLITDFLIL